MERDLGILLDKLCMEWGFCIPPSDRARVATSRRSDAAEFASEVLRAEGLDPDYEVHWFRRIRQRFRDQFGESASAGDYPEDPTRASRD